MAMMSDAARKANERFSKITAIDKAGRAKELDEALDKLAPAQEQPVEQPKPAALQERLNRPNSNRPVRIDGNGAISTPGSWF